MSLLDAITDAIANYEHVDGEVVVTGFVLVASFMGSEGRAIYCDTLDGQRDHESLGLLAYATAIETARAVTTFNEED